MTRKWNNKLILQTTDKRCCMEIKSIWTKKSLVGVELATPWTEPKCLTDWATLANKDMEILDSCLTGDVAWKWKVFEQKSQW